MDIEEIIDRARYFIERLRFVREDIEFIGSKTDKEKLIFAYLNKEIEELIGDMEEYFDKVEVDFVKEVREMDKKKVKRKEKEMNKEESLEKAKKEINRMITKFYLPFFRFQYELKNAIENDREEKVNYDLRAFLEDVKEIEREVFKEIDIIYEGEYNFRGVAELYGKTIFINKWMNTYLLGEIGIRLPEKKWAIERFLDKKHYLIQYFIFDKSKEEIISDLETEEKDYYDVEKINDDRKIEFVIYKDIFKRDLKMSDISENISRQIYNMAKKNLEERY